MVIMGGLIIAELSMLVQGNETRTYYVLLVFGARLCARWITVFSMVIEVKMRTCTVAVVLHRRFELQPLNSD